MSVWLVFYNGVDESIFMGVYSTKEKAEARRDDLKSVDIKRRGYADWYTVEEREVDSER